MSRWSEAGGDLGVAVSLGAVSYGFYQPTNSLPTAKFPLTLMTITAVTGLAFLGKAVYDLRRPREDEEIHFRLARTRKLIDSLPDPVAARLGLSFTQRQRRSQKRIKKFMFDLLRSASKATIVTRDLSWVAADDPILKEIASAGELTILSCCSSPTTALSKKLQALADIGADVRHIKEDAKVRLTLTSTSGHERVAVARQTTGRHTILQSSHSDDPLFGLAKSLASSLERHSRRISEKAEN